MDTTGFDAAYRSLLTAAASIADPAAHPGPAREDIDWTLSHLALSDPILTAAARDVLDGRPAVVDNRDAMDARALAELTASTSHQDRVAMVRAHAQELGAVLRAIPGHAAATPVIMRLCTRDGHSLPEQMVPWRDLIELRVHNHLPGHTARLAAHALAPADGARPTRSTR
ncbi:hypothetical protein [Amycolatopsis viridis]|uniref:DinB-like domain-containing protein n=1 Tax=Amycolatopsis viridis TaxID=185678 RepID=A0ABX0STH4_9PSEU|nr:hypothetical protein [Amycolatopsis viridis]NIH80268.1 hypothetical protein [Amycolatopsis viridis]